MGLRLAARSASQPLHPSLIFWYLILRHEFGLPSPQLLLSAPVKKPTAGWPRDRSRPENSLLIPRRPSRRLIHADRPRGRLPRADSEDVVRSFRLPFP